MSKYSELEAKLAALRSTLGAAVEWVFVDRDGVVYCVYDYRYGAHGTSARTPRDGVAVAAVMLHGANCWYKPAASPSYYFSSRGMTVHAHMEFR